MKKLFKQIFNLETLKRTLIYSAFTESYSSSCYSVLNGIIKDMDAEKDGEKNTKDCITLIYITIILLGE
ncbi:hypothetical protein AC231_07705 [Clostridium pasteurianum]|uniref:hypothetical protein n=1 Tax=Clostridium pasteurianum TaxID=1501 RepID=UPI000978A816|nr:hypothetical protein [Clostridium pasteurianum]OMH20576.1 hypothetical protein AC231_07705 [Clostridium pasteurianum]